MDKNLFFYELEGRGYIFQNKKWDEAKHVFEDDMLNMAWEMWSSAKHSVKAQAVPEGFVLVPERNVHDHYIANHLKGTTCSVDVSKLTSNDGDRIYGKLRSFDCLGSDGNTLIYDLESSNFNLVKTTGNTGDFVLVEKTKLMQIIGSAAIIEPITRGNPLMSKYKTELEFILSTVRAMIEAQEQSHENG